MDPELAHYQYIHPKAMNGQTSTDGGFPSILGDLDEGSSESDPRSRLWEAKYQFRKEMLPSFLGEAFGRKVSRLCFHPFLVSIMEISQIFSTGKSLNFIKYSCGDSDWVITRQRLNTTKGGMPIPQAVIATTHFGMHAVDLKYSDILGLEKSIDAAYEIASQRLFDVFFDKFKLLDHLLALKHYFLLGYGDFADTLMDALG